MRIDIVGHAAAAMRAPALCCLAIGCVTMGCSAGGGGAAEVSDGSNLPPPFVGSLQGPPSPASVPTSAPRADGRLFEDDSPAPPVNEGCGSNLTGVLRDFQANHPDFGDAVADDRGLVEPWLGADRKPVYAPAGPTATTSGAENGQLAIDLGGVHGTQTDSVDLDAEAATLGLVVGAAYPLDLFQAERHATGSTFRVDTSLRFTSCGTIILRRTQSHSALNSKPHDLDASPLPLLT
jgi:hypothetical protein